MLYCGIQTAQRFLETAGTVSMLTLTLKFKDSLKSKCWDKRHMLPSHFRTRHIHLDGQYHLDSWHQPTYWSKKKKGWWFAYFLQLKDSVGSRSKSAELSGLVSLSPNFRSWARIFKLLTSPGIDRSQGINSASLCGLSLNCKRLRSPGIDSKESIPRNWFRQPM